MVFSDTQQWEDEAYLRNQQALNNSRDSKTRKSSESSKQSFESLEAPSSVIQQSQQLPPSINWLVNKPTKPHQYSISTPGSENQHKPKRFEREYDAKSEIKSEAKSSVKRKAKSETSSTPGPGGYGVTEVRWIDQGAASSSRAVYRYRTPG